MSHFEKKFVNDFNKNFLFEKNPKFAVAVSGGPDSIALTFLLKKWIYLKGGKLTVLIIDHRIRKNSFEEAKTVREYLLQKKINSVIIKIPKNKVIKYKMNEARSNRFSSIFAYCKKKKIYNLFFGHHKDDNIETFLLRKSAGSNFEGLNSIKKEALVDNIRVIRPLLNYTKKQILQYNKFKKLKYIHDPSNKDEKYSRVIIRKYLHSNCKYNKKIFKEFMLIRKNYKDYKKMIFQIFNIINYKITKNLMIFDLNKFILLDKEIQVKIIEIIYKFFNPKRPFLRYKKIINFLEKLEYNSEIVQNLSNMRIIKNKNHIYFGNKFVFYKKS